MLIKNRDNNINESNSTDFSFSHDLIICSNFFRAILDIYSHVRFCELNIYKGLFYKGL